MNVANHFEEFERDMKQMSDWCESSRGCHKDSSSLYVDLIVAIKDGSSGDAPRWIRGKVAQILSERYVLFDVAVLPRCYTGLDRKNITNSTSVTPLLSLWHPKEN